MTGARKISLEEARKLVEVSVITIKSEEFSAVLRRFPPTIEAKGRTQYNIAKFTDSNNATHHVAVVKSFEKGDLPAQSIANALIEDLGPSLILIVGIAGAKPEKEFTLGDVIVANRMYDFNVSAANVNGKIEYDTRSAPAHRAAQIVASNLVANAAKYKGWNSETSLEMQRPKVEIISSNIKGHPAWRKRIREALSHYFGPGGADRQPIVLDGPIGSSSTLIKDPTLFAEWLDKTRDVLAVDMEISGVFEAARSDKGDIPVIVIRGISDIVGFKRDPLWTKYACELSASFCKALLSSDVLTPELFAGGRRETFRSVRSRIGHLNLEDCSNDDLATISKLAETEFGPMAANHSRILWLKKVDTEAYKKVVDESGNIVGFYDAFRLSKLGTTAVKQGKFNITKCPKKYFRSDKTYKYVNVYIGGVYGANQNSRAMILGAIIERLSQRHPKMVFARAASKDGLRLLEKYMFVPVHAHANKVGDLFMRPG